MSKLDAHYFPISVDESIQKTPIIKKYEMNNEYVIINRTKIEERIKQIEEYEGTVFSEDLKQILSGSIPLIPELKLAYDAAICCNDCDKLISKEEYILNLKLDI